MSYPLGQQPYMYHPPASGVQLFVQQQQQPPPPYAHEGVSQQYMQQYQDYGQPSQHYGSYGTFFQNAFQTNAYQAYQFHSPNDLWEIFVREMSKNPANVSRQAIQAEDLCSILNNTPSIRNHYGISWSRELCSIMIAMLDRSQDGFMQYQEYMELQQCLVSWFNVFLQHDANRSGFIEAHELSRLIKGLFCYTISADCLSTLLRRYSRTCVGPHGDVQCRIAFDDFVAMCVRMRAYTDAFRQRDRHQHGRQETGQCTFQYDDVVSAMCDVLITESLWMSVLDCVPFIRPKSSLREFESRRNLCRPHRPLPRPS